MTRRISLIIPCYNEERRLDVDSYKKFFKQNPNIKFLFVDDGSSDGTKGLLQNWAKEFSLVEMISLPKNSGKAEAVRTGMMKALAFDADYIGYWDADLATSLDQLTLFEDYMIKDNQVIMGSRIRRLGSHIERLRSRHILGRLFATVASIVLGIHVYDTQCGAKLFHRSVVEKAFGEKFLSYWIFDVELLARLRFSGTLDLNRIIEVPLLEWKDVKGSKLRLVDFLKAPLEMWSIYRKYSRGY